MDIPNISYVKKVQGQSNALASITTQYQLSKLKQFKLNKSICTRSCRSTTFHVIQYNVISTQ